jgi:hypothetical protein
METSDKRRVGRPKALPQTGPLVLEGCRVRVKIEIEIPEATADELQDYARWVELSSSVATKDALFATVDYALRDVFRRDRLWQVRRRKGAEAEPAPSTKAASAPASPPSPLPPPSAAVRPVPSPVASAIGR